MPIVLKNITDFTARHEHEICDLCKGENEAKYCNAVLVDERLDPYKFGHRMTICAICAEFIGIFDEEFSELREYTAECRCGARWDVYIKDTDNAKAETIGVVCPTCQADDWKIL
jgi:hypothetical protein